MKKLTGIVKEDEFIRLGFEKIYDRQDLVIFSKENDLYFTNRTDEEGEYRIRSYLDKRKIGEEDDSEKF
jgi:hypothetical protein